MNQWLTAIITVLLAGLLLLYRWLYWREKKKQTAASGENPARGVLYTCVFFLLEYTACILMIYLGVFLPLAYLLFYASNLLGSRKVYGYSRRKTVLITNLFVIHFFIMHMALLSAASLVRNVAVYQILQDPLWCAAVLALAMIGMSVSSLIQSRMHTRQYDSLFFDDTERMRQLRAYVWFALGYTFFDSATCVFDLVSPLLSYFLLGSCLLLGLLIYLLWVHAIRVERNLHYEEEYRKLEEERARQLQKEMELHRIAYIDSLTGTYTRQYLFHTLDRWMEENRAFSLVYLDLDGLKAVNDRLGHPCGDAYIQGVTCCINQALHKQDLFARVGGDEFLIVLPDCREGPAYEKMQAIRQTVEQANTTPYPASFSFGIVERQADCPTPLSELLRSADGRMYRDKKREKASE